MSKNVTQSKRSRQIIRSNVTSNDDKRAYNARNVLELKFSGMSYRAIAKYYGKDVATIFNKLKPFRELADAELVDAVQANRVPLLKAAQWKLLSKALSPETMEKANLGNFFYGFEKLDHAIRLEQGASTANLAIHQIVERVERDLAKKRPKQTPKELEKETGDHAEFLS